MANSGAEPIDPKLAKKLAALTVPALPAGFAERALAAALALPEDGPRLDAPPLPRQRPAQGRTGPRRWWRTGAVGLGAIAAGMISISAAAMGYFGEPVRLAIHHAPVIGKVIERVIPDRPRRKAKLVPARKDAEKPAPVPAASTLPAQAAQPAEPLAPPWRSRTEMRRILADPEERRAWIEAHPEAARRIAERRAARIERRRAVHAELRRRRAEAGIGPELSSGEIAPQRPWRLERRERLRQWRENRRRMIEQRLERDDAPEPQP